MASRVSWVSSSAVQNMGGLSLKYLFSKMMSVPFVTVPDSKFAKCILALGPRFN